MRVPEVVYDFVGYLSGRFRRDLPLSIGTHSDDLVHRLGEDLIRSPIGVIAVQSDGKRSVTVSEELEYQIRAAGLYPDIVGWTESSGETDTSWVIGIVRESGFSPPRRTPDTFDVLAIMVVRDEVDVIRPIVRRLLDDGIGLYILDNWSSDGTWEILTELSTHFRLVGLERFPPYDTDDFVHLDVLKRKTEIAYSIRADWYLNVDADEIRSSPWPDLSLRDGLYRVDIEGFNAVDFTVVNFYPTGNGDFPDGADPESYFEYCDFGRRPGHFRQVKAWKCLPTVDLISSYGHAVNFSGRRVYPFKLLLKHYPFRSQSHGERKIRERLKRTEKSHRELGISGHYRLYGKDHQFVRDPAELLRFDDAFPRRYLIECLTGIGVERDASST